MGTSHQLTVIIPFLNERDEVIHTVNSVRQSIGYKADIIIINDASDDSYNYDQLLTPYNVTYIQNKTRLGVAESRNLGIRLMETPYFLLLDAHMRFYDNIWLDILVNRLKEDDRKILCCQTRALKKVNNMILPYEREKSYGAHIILDKCASILQVEWIRKEKEPSKQYESIPCIYGAAYAGSKRYWEYLKGLDGLVHYGFDETYISLKVWMEGGVCELLKNIEVGHIYRDRFPYRVSQVELLFNRMWIAELLLTEELRKYVFSVCREQGGTYSYEKALIKLNELKTKISTLRNYYKMITKRSLGDVIKLNTQK